MATGEVRLVDLVKKFDDVVAVDGINLDIAGGEFFSLLGPSGCGKTTTLRLIAGFERPTAGRVLLDGTDVAHTPPHKRNVNTVFQSYALFPHLSVEDNVAFGLRFKNVTKADVAGMVGNVLSLVRLEGLGRRRPTQLSGGQQQRVALARALVNRPRVLLLDEPLGALDLKLREEMQIELKAIQEQVGITFVYVTHDQDEALTMSDRLAVFNGGRIEQIGSPADVYERPATPFVAGFVGTSNLMTADAAERVIGRRGTFTIRPEKIRLAEPSDAAGPDEGSTTGVIRSVVYLGSDTRYHVALDAGPDVVVTEQNLGTSSMEALAAQGRMVRLIWKRHHVLALADS